MSLLFTPVRIGRLELPNRLVMAPMTRSRADDETGVPPILCRPIMPSAQAPA